VSTYRAGTLRRDRRSRERLEQLDRQILDVLQADHPQSVRHVFYRMTDPRLPEPVEKSDRGYRHVQARCVAMRRAGRLPYGWIADATRRGYFVDTFDDGGDFLRRMAGHYRADLWAQSEHRVEVWTESRSIASVLHADCDELAVSLFPCGGFSSISFVHDACEFANQYVGKDSLVILYAGDFDPAGVLIDVTLEHEVRRHLHGRFDLTFRRLAINEAQIATYDLPAKPRKSTDLRARHVSVAVEAEAMPASVLRGIVRRAVEEYLPVGALHVAKVAEESERKHLLRMAEIFRGDA